MSNNPIGIFDSGVGGLTIYREIHRQLPHENIVYLADSKHAPYGLKSKEEVIALSIKNTELLLEKNCKIIVVACNTASTQAVKTLRERFDVPIIRTQPGIKPAALNSKTRKVGILATRGTLKSELLKETSDRFAQGVEVLHQHGDGIVELIESGNMDSAEMQNLLTQYLKPMLDKHIDHLVLGCTHYPFLIPMMEKIVHNEVNIIDTGPAIARQTKNILTLEKLRNPSKQKPKREFFTNADVNVLQLMLNRISHELKAEFLAF